MIEYNLALATDSRPTKMERLRRPDIPQPQLLWLRLIPKTWYKRTRELADSTCPATFIDCTALSRVSPYIYISVDARLSRWSQLRRRRTKQWQPRVFCTRLPLSRNSYRSARRSGSGLFVRRDFADGGRNIENTTLNLS